MRIGNATKGGEGGELLNLKGLVDTAEDGGTVVGDGGLEQAFDDKGGVDGRDMENAELGWGHGGSFMG
ncbi:MAG: hypothetical protein GY906_22590 [bacterium]|nr:hypothetical protein [bacterium]